MSPKAPMESMVFFFKRSKRPFYFPRKRPRLIRFSGQSFAFDYNFIGRFFYVLLEVGLKNQVVYKVPNFLHKIEALYSGMKLPLLQEDVFLFSGSYLFAAPFSPKVVGYFPINFFNSIFLGVGFSKYSFRDHSLLAKKAAFKSTMQRVLVAVDSHLSLLFSGKPIGFPKNSNYIRSFKFAMNQVHLISGDHNVSSYTAKAEGPFLKFGGLSFRRYRDFFFKRFFRELRPFFLRLLFSSSLSLASVRGMQVLDFFFDYFYKFVLKTVNYLTYLKLFLGSFAFSFYRSFVPLKFFIAEVLYLVVSALGRPLGLFYKLSFLRKFFFLFFRSFLFSGIFKGAFSAAASKISPFNLHRLPLFNDLSFAGGTFLNCGFSRRCYREFIFKRVFFKRSSKRKNLLLWVDRLGDANLKKKGRWINYIFGYYRKKRRQALLRERLRLIQGKGFPLSYFPFSTPKELRLLKEPSPLASSLYYGLINAEAIRGYWAHRISSFAPGNASWNDFLGRVFLFKIVLKLCNEKAARRYKAEKKNLSFLRSRLLSLTKRARPILAKKGVKYPERLIAATIRSSRLGYSKGKRISFAYRKGRRGRAFNPQCLKLGRLAYNNKAGPFFRARKILPRWPGRSPIKAVLPPGFRLKLSSSNRKKLLMRKQHPFVFITKRLLRFLLLLFWRHPLVLSFSEPRVYYRLRRGRFTGLLKRLFRKRVLFLKRRPWVLPSRSRRFFVFTLGTLVNGNPQRRHRRAFRRRKKLCKPLLRRFKQQKLFFKSYSHCYFFNTSLVPFFLKKSFAYSARFFVLHWAFQSVINFNGSVVTKGVALALALRVYFFFAFSRVSFIAQRIVTFLFSLLEVFFKEGTLDRRFVRQCFFQKGSKLYFSVALKFFFLRQGLERKFIKRLKRSKAKVPRSRGFIVRKKFPYGSAFKKRALSRGSSSIMQGRGKNGLSRLSRKPLAKELSPKAIVPFAKALGHAPKSKVPASRTTGQRREKGVSSKKPISLTVRKALVSAKALRARFFYEKRQRLAKRGVAKALSITTRKRPPIGGRSLMVLL